MMLPNRAIIVHDTSALSVIFSTPQYINGKQKNFRMKRDKSNNRLVLNIRHHSSFSIKAIAYFTGVMLLFEHMNQVFHAQSYE